MESSVAISDETMAADTEGGQRVCGDRSYANDENEKKTQALR